MDKLDIATKKTGDTLTADEFNAVTAKVNELAGGAADAASVTALQGTVEQNTADIAGLNESVTALQADDAALQKSVTAMQGSVGGYDAAIAAKADKATTLAGYGITDAYQKTEADSLLEGKADKSHTHSADDITGLSAALDGKAEAADLKNFEATLAANSATQLVAGGDVTLGSTRGAKLVGYDGYSVTTGSGSTAMLKQVIEAGTVAGALDWLAARVVTGGVTYEEVKQ